MQNEACCKNSYRLLVIIYFRKKNTILDIWQSSEYASDLNHLPHKSKWSDPQYLNFLINSN